MSDAPSVLVPPMLYLPVVESPDGSQHAIVRDLTNGRTGLLAYTALDRLVEKCGDKQPWILVATSAIGTIREVQPFDVVAFDIAVPDTLRREGRIA